MLLCATHGIYSGAASAPKPTASSSSSISISSAPAIPTFEPPEPTMNDEYPGYYQLPSGAWKAHEPEYYATFLKRWQKEYNDQVRALEKGVAKGFEGMEKEGMEDVDAKKEMERAKKEIKEREERKAITKGAGGAPDKPKMNINVSFLAARLIFFAQCRLPRHPSSAVSLAPDISCRQCSRRRTRTENSWKTKSQKADATARRLGTNTVSSTALHVIFRSNSYLQDSN